MKKTNKKVNSDLDFDKKEGSFAEKVNRRRKQQAKGLRRTAKKAAKKAARKK